MPPAATIGPVANMIHQTEWWWRAEASPNICATCCCSWVLSLRISLLGGLGGGPDMRRDGFVARRAVVANRIAEFAIVIEISGQIPLHMDMAPAEIQRRVVFSTPIPRLESDRSQPKYGISLGIATHFSRPAAARLSFGGRCANRRA